MHLLAGKERIIAWLKKNGWPEPNGHKCFIWALSPISGKVADEAWENWDGSIESLPKDKKVILKRRDFKSYTHVHIDSEEGSSEKIGKGEPRQIESFLLPPEIVNEHRELAKKSEDLVKKEAYLREWESELRDQEIDIKKSQAMTVRIGGELDIRTKNVMDRIKEYEEHLNRRKLNDEEYIRELSDTMGELIELKEKHIIFSKLSYTIDKIAMSMAIRGLKNLSDEELKKLPPGFMDDLAKFLADRAEREMFRTVPKAYEMVGEMFTRLPTSTDKHELCRIIMTWLIETDINSFNRIGKEVIDDLKQRQAS